MSIPLQLVCCISTSASICLCALNVARICRRMRRLYACSATKIFRGEPDSDWFDSTAGSFDVDAAIVTLGLLKDAIAAPIAALDIGGTVAIKRFQDRHRGVTARRRALPTMSAFGASLVGLLATQGLFAAGFG